MDIFTRQGFGEEVQKMRFKCRDCGAYFDEYEEVQESRGEFWGMPAYETMCYCPECGSDDFDEAEIVEAEEEQDNDDDGE